ncbi:MAG: tol-pal system protein YbgF [Hydrogenothermaceae bacterium]|nr:tol-pal system protein YbgF [Hydrogenothermaceae bacterium]
MKISSVLAIFGLVLLSSCASDDKILSLQRELIEIKQEINQLKQDNQGNKEKMETLNRRLDRLSQTVAENSMEIEKLKVSKSTQSVQETKLPPPPPQQLPREGKEQVSVPSDEKGLYQYALDTYYKGNYEEARKYFVEFLKKYPDSDLYGNAVFWAGQTFYGERKFGDSIEIFKALIQKCDEGKIKRCIKYPDALLKIGFAYLEMGDNQNGKKYLQDLIKKYPDSEPAQLARKKLEVIR